MQVPGCYAASLDNCSGTLTGEHIISKSLLEDMIKMGGNHYRKELINKFIGKNNFKVKHLCKGHNNFLSDADAEMKKYVLALVEMYQLSKYYENNKHKFPLKYEIKGVLLERWFVKTILNIYLGDPRCTVDLAPILPAIFLKQGFRAPFGLCFMIKKAIDNKGSIEFNPQLSPTNQLVNVHVHIGNHYLVFLPAIDPMFAYNIPFRIGNEFFKFDVNISSNVKNINFPFITPSGEKVNVADISLTWNLED